MADKGKSWYTKYRPVTMQEYAGSRINGIIKRRFNGNVDEYPHTILIEGTRGCGKTTLARILPKYYMCESPNEDGTPCEKCESCRQINEVLIAGESATVEVMGVTEVDVTTANGKEELQRVMEEAMIAPTWTKKKFILFDEIHIASQAAQTSLLKLIEDIPEHLIVVFATTNPEKVLDTIISRCQLRIEVKKQTIEDMTNRLEVISRREGLKFSRNALALIAKKGDRVPRECINNLETIAKTYENEVTVENVISYFGDIENEKYIEFFNCANSGLIESVKFVNRLQDEEVNISDFISGLSSFVINAISIKAGLNAEEANEKYIKSVRKIFELYKVSEFDTLLLIVERIIHDFNKNNEANNKIILINNMLRIGKIKSFFSDNDGAIEEERKISLAEASKMNQYNIEEAVESSKKIFNIEDFIEEEEDNKVILDEEGESFKIDQDLLDKVSKGCMIVDSTEDEETTETDALDEL